MRWKNVPTVANRTFHNLAHISFAKNNPKRLFAISEDPIGCYITEIEWDFCGIMVILQFHTSVLIKHCSDFDWCFFNEVRVILEMSDET